MQPILGSWEHSDKPSLPFKRFCKTFLKWLERQQIECRIDLAGEAILKRSALFSCDIVDHVISTYCPYPANFESTVDRDLQHDEVVLCSTVQTREDGRTGWIWGALLKTSGVAWRRDRSKSLSDFVARLLVMTSLDLSLWISLDWNEYERESYGWTDSGSYLALRNTSMY